jgi:hypothetical protein
MDLKDQNTLYDTFIKNKTKGDILDINNAKFEIFMHKIHMQMINDIEDAVPVLDF